MKQEEYTNEEKKGLLKVARATLEKYLIEKKVFQPESDNKNLLQERGVFVTLHKDGKLRGCIGTIKPAKPLIESVRDNAIAAGCEDPRFLSLIQEELSDIDIEISVLTEPKSASLEQISPGIDGVILRNGSNSATFLPQVWEELPRKEHFLSHLSQKAGLYPEDWQNSSTQYETYQAIVFGEKDFK